MKKIICMTMVLFIIGTLNAQDKTPAKKADTGKAKFIRAVDSKGRPSAAKRSNQPIVEKDLK